MGRSRPAHVPSCLALLAGLASLPAPLCAAQPKPPEIARLKDLCLNTEIVRQGLPNAMIVAPRSGIYARQVAQIVAAVETLTGARLPVAADDAPEAALPLRGNVIAVGNRSTNRFIGELYDRYHVILDLRYPGPEGYTVRTLHNPFGNGFNVVFAGGSDAAGVAAATEVLLQRLSEAAKDRSLTIGRLAEIRLGKGIEIPKDIREFETWEASKGYGSVGYFGWNSLSKRMAMYYMTGDAFHAREFLRLAFPDARALKEIAEIDGERIEDKTAPLSGPYHYNAHLMILLWDLIEESPVFNEADRLRVTRAFSRQLLHPSIGSGYVEHRDKPRACVGSRHDQWAAVSIYCLGRYFQTYYPDPVWQACLESGAHQFRSLHQHAWVSGENDNLFWYNTAIAPIFTYMLLSGDRAPMRNGVAAELLRGQEILVSGRVPDWALNSAAVDFLHKVAYLTQDGRWLEYRDRTGVDLNVFRLGQSFWPEEHLKPKPPDDLAGAWSVHRLPEPMWRARNNGFKLEESFQFMSFRSRADAQGDFILLDGFNGASRNPYHSFAILELRIAGHTILQGYLNQLLTKADGMVEPKVAMNAALKHRDVLGGTAVAVGEVPDQAFCTWRRAVLQRIGRYALIADDLEFRSDSDDFEVRMKWEAAGGFRPSGSGDPVLRTAGPAGQAPKEAAICASDPVTWTVSGRQAGAEWRGPARRGRRRVFFSVVGMQPAGAGSIRCLRVADNAAAVSLPEPGLAVCGSYEGIRADVAVLAGDHLYGRAVEAAQRLLKADRPVDVDWDFPSGALHVTAPDGVRIGIAVDLTRAMRIDGASAKGAAGEGGLAYLDLPKGRHAIDGAFPRREILDEIAAYLSAARDRGSAAREPPAKAPVFREESAVPELPIGMAVRFEKPVVHVEVFPSRQGPVLCAAEGRTVHVVTPEGREIRAMSCDGEIRLLRGWAEHGLLLAGCADERVIAFDESGGRKWVFVSEMDPEVFRAAKTYWFKTAPGHEGIHGLHTGIFLDGRSQAFVGSACTLEILDDGGKLLKRRAVFWGCGHRFAILDRPDGSRDLLIARQPTDSHALAVINSRSPDRVGRGFGGVPAGHTYVGGWACMSRRHIFLEDMDGDGRKEVAGEINGTWNRVTVWSADGRPLFNAQFGPGAPIPARNIRGMDVADLDGDGKKEIAVATSDGTLVVLDGQCRKVWAKRLASPAAVLKCVTPAGGKAPWIVAGCEDGGIRVFEGHGRVRAGKVTGAPTRIESLTGASGVPQVVFGTDKGELKTFLVAR